MNLSAQEYLAKLLAKENLTVQHGNYSTASFDVINRVLRLPLWADKGKDVYDLLVGHEVGHALFTPADGWHNSDKEFDKIPKAYLNIVEDIRIERLIQTSYPGIVRRFKSGYKRLFDDNLFGTDDRDINEAGLMDRLNVSSKSRGYVSVDFSDDESPLIKEAMSVETWDDVVAVCKKLFDFIESKKEDEQEDQMPIGPTGEEDPNTESPASPPSNGSREEDSEEGGETTNPESNPSNDEGESQEGSGEGDSVPSEEKSDAHETWTEDSFRNNEDELLETKPSNDWNNSDQVQSKFSCGISDLNIKNMVYSYKQAEAMRAEYVDDMDSRDKSHSPYLSSECKKDWNSNKSTYKSQANLIAKDFERKKAAFEYSRATTSKSGKLDPLKMHSYKYSEDIFLSTTKLAQAKSHGIVMFVDLSGSMGEIIEDVMAQTITIAMFCRQVGIPFEAYSFTTTAYWRALNKGIDTVHDLAPTEIDSDCSKVVEIFSSQMNKKTFDEACYVAFAMGKVHSSSRTRSYYLYGDLHSIDQMGSTPLIQTCYAASKITKAFTRRHAIQNTNIMFLTDGMPDSVSMTPDPKADLATHRNNKCINFEGKLVQGTNARNIYVAMLLRLKELTGATIMGFHLATNASTFGQGYTGIEEKIEFPDLIQTWRKQGFSEWKKEKGYDNYFIIKINRSARFDSDEFTPKKADTISDLKREFKKFNKTKKGNKQLVARITDAVAA